MPHIYNNAAVIEWNYVRDVGNPKREGSFVVASTRTLHRVFQAKYTPSTGWHTRNRGRYIYAWAMLPDYPPLASLEK